jgi:hypothetical protein
MKFLLIAFVFFISLAAPALSGDPLQKSMRAEPGVVQFEESLREKGTSLWSTPRYDPATFNPSPDLQREAKTAIPPKSFRVDNLGSRTIAFAYEMAAGRWAEEELRPLAWKDFPCEACSDKTTITFHNGMEAQYFEVKLGQEIVIEWSQLENVWVLTTRVEDALKRIAAPAPASTAASAEAPAGQTASPPATGWPPPAGQQN